LAFPTGGEPAVFGLILAGGAGARLGGVDKAFLDLGGQPLVARVLARVAPQVGRVAISANGDAARFAGFGMDVLGDGALVGKGPLAGVAAGLVWAGVLGAEALLTVPVDTPFVPEDLADALRAGPAVAVWRGRQHHLVASWPVACLPELLAFLAAPGAYKVRDALAVCGARPVVFGGDDDPFLNINTAEDLSEAERRLF
jgi:molybdopterin-guanine dinucleotide biosynthesis protein A